MKTIRLLAGGFGLLILLAPSAVRAAQSEGPKARLMAKYDTNRNGVIDGDEIAAVSAAFAAAPDGEFKKYDANHDGKLDDVEIATIKGPGGKARNGKKKDKAGPPADAVKDTAKPATDAAQEPGK